MSDIGEGEPNVAKKVDEGKWPNEPHSLPNCDLLNQIVFIP